MTEIQNDALLHRVYFERYANSEVVKALKVLSGANKVIAEKLKETSVIATKKRYHEIARMLDLVTWQAAEDYEGLFDVEGLIDEEVGSRLSMLTSGISADMEFILPSVHQVKSAVLFKPIAALGNRTFKETFDFFQKNLYSTWDSAVRTGFLTGQPTSDIVRTVMGSVTGMENDLKPNRMAQIRRAVERNTRTILQAFADESHRAFYDGNDGIISGYRVMATLDRRTCLECGALDGRIYRNLKDVPEIPRHYNCRCVLVPVTRFDKEHAGRRAAEGQDVDGALTYDRWLSMQDDETQREILGGRYAFYRQGASIDGQFFSDGRLMTMDDLKQKNLTKY